MRLNQQIRYEKQSMDDDKTKHKIIQQLTATVEVLETRQQQPLTAAAPTVATVTTADAVKGTVDVKA